jgi:hypothetical protein
MKYHYVYRISNLKSNKHYYGVRTSNIIPSKDLGYMYFSSSRDKEFMADQKQNPQNYKYKVIRTFKTREEATLIEIKLHNKFNVGINESFYNKSKQTSTGFDTTGLKIPRTKEHCLNLSSATKGIKKSKEHRRKLHEANKGKKVQKKLNKNEGRAEESMDKREKGNTL